MDRVLTTIQVSVPVRDQLKALGRKGDTYDDVISKLLEKLGKGDC